MKAWEAFKKDRFFLTRSVTFPGISAPSNAHYDKPLLPLPGLDKALAAPRRAEPRQRRHAPYVFSVSTNVVGGLRVVRTLREPFPDCGAVCGGVIHLTTLET